MDVKKIPKVQAFNLTLSIFCVFYMFSSLLHCIFYNNIMAPFLELLTHFHYHQWKEDMEMQLHSKRLYRATMGIEVEPIHYVDKENYWNKLDEAYECLCL